MKKIKLMIFSFFLLLSFVGFADNTIETNARAIDLMWMLIAAFLVFFMQAGFAMVETGFTRAKNAVNIMMKNLMDLSIGSLGYFFIGFGLMFGASKLGLFGFSNFFLNHVADPVSIEGSWELGFWLFQAVFAATAATIVSGSMAERTQFKAYLFYSLIISAIIYPIVGHWIWGGGWLSGLGMIDFAGSTVVHSVGGWAALVGAIVLGPRIGKYTNGKSNAFPGHNIPLAALGVFILWFGWFGFNAGSTVAGTDLSIAIIAVNTNLAAATGALIAMLFVWIRFGKPDVSMALNGALAGLVGITAGCANVSPMSAIIIGGFAGAIVVLSVEIIDKFLKIDDPVGAISVHGVCGAFGTIAVGLFASAKYGGVDGLFAGGGFGLLKTQLIGVVSVFAWVVLASLVLFLFAKYVIGLRVSREEELRGLDIGEHGMEAYEGFQIFSNK